MVTIKDVARAAGVSTSTVSRALNNHKKISKESRQKVLKVVEELGFRPNVNARALVSQKSNSLGVVLPKLSMPFFGALACGAESYANSKGYRVLLSNAQDSEENELEAVNSLVQNGCDAIILHSNHASDEALVELSEKVPGLVFINRFVPSIASRCVWLDNNFGAQDAARFILSQGHKDIVVITREESNRDTQNRLDGIRTVFGNANLPIADSSIIRVTGDANMEAGQKGVAKMLEDKLSCSAILAYNDNMAIGVIHELHARGIKVPEQISVIGFDDLLFSMTCIPQLTTMHYPIDEMSQHAAKIAIGLAEGSTEYSVGTHLFLPKLVQRGSVSSRI